MIPKDPVFLGIDTSCYTTSLALVDGKNRLLAEKRLLLPVKAGTRGLRQSEGVFYHTLNLPQLMEALSEALDFPLKERLAAVAASVKPCRRQGSYMPVFRTGEGLAKSLAAAFGVPFIPATHQEGHLMAALWSAEEKPPLPFFAYHLSGGTTELMLVKKIEKKPRYGFDYSIIAGTMDIPAGQLVDRVGVALGLPFPAGPRLQELAGELDLAEDSPASPGFSIPTCCREGKTSFSGGEAWALRALARGDQPAQIARSIEHYIAASLEKSVLQAASGYEAAGVIFMGGVAANTYIRRRLRQRLNRRLPCFFARQEYSSDNALGIALIGAETIKALYSDPT